MKIEKDTKIVKRGYNFSPELIIAWEEFHRPSKDFSPSAAGAFLIWMSLPSHIREKARHLACSSDIDSAIKEFAEYLNKSLKIAAVTEYLESLNDEQLGKVLSASKQIR